VGDGIPNNSKYDCWQTKTVYTHTRARTYQRHTQKNSRDRQTDGTTHCNTGETMQSDRCHTGRFCRTSARLYRATKSLQTLRLSSCTLRLCRVKATFHYTDPTGPARTFCGPDLRETPLGLCGSPTKSVGVRVGPRGSGRVRVVEFCLKQTRLVYHFSRFTISKMAKLFHI